MKKISAKILITQLVILCMTLFIFPMTVKAENVSASLFLYNVQHSYTEHNELIRPFLHQYDFYITANHEVSGRYIISISTRSDATSHTWSSTAGEIYISDVMGAESGCAVEVTGQKDLIVTIKYYTDSPIDILNVRSIQFSQSDLDGNPITTDQSLWSYVQKIEDHEVQLLAQAGFINDQLTDTRQKLTAISNLITTTNTTLSSLLTTATNILTKVTSIDSALQQIDNTIDTISWDSSNIQLLGYGPDINNITPIGSNAYYQLSSSDYLIFQINNGQKAQLDLYNLNIPILTNFNYSIYYSSNATNITQLPSSYIYYSELDNMRLNLYIKSVGYQTKYYIYIKSNASTAYYYATQFKNYGSINANDIEYWELLGYFNRYNFYKQQTQDNQTIIQRLTELLNGNTNTNNSVNANDQSNQQFQQQTQQYDQIESTFQSTFTTDQTAVQNQIVNNTLSSIFADTTLWFTQQLNNLYNASGNFKILFTMPLLLGLALFFIGRGAKTAAPNTIDSFYSSEMVDNTDGVRTYHLRRRSNAHKVYHGFNRGKK